MSTIKVSHELQRKVDQYIYNCFDDDSMVTLLDAGWGDDEVVTEAMKRTLRKIRRALPSVED